MRQAATAVAPRGWGWTWIATIVGTVACTAMVGWLRSLEGEAGNLLVVALLTAPALFILINGLRLMLATRRRQAIAAATDPLTGLLHREAFMAAAEDYLTALHESGRPGSGALLAIDIDNLKAINDAYDPEAGDAAIAEVAHALRGSVRETDLVGRIGGEEFGILLIGTDQIQSQMVADRLCRAVDDLRFAVEGVVQPLAISVGIGLFRETSALPDIIGAADRALYAAKQNGGNRSAMSPVQPRKLRVAA